MVLREGGRAPPTSWQREHCFRAKHGDPEGALKCEANSDRENNCWEKSAMVLRYLEEFGAPHVLLLDADAALVHRERDTVANLISELDSAGKDLLLANEDYKKRGGADRINCAMMFVKNTAFTRRLFASLVRTHVEGGSRCKSECNCLQEWLKSDPELKQRLLVVSGLRYNRQECTFRCCTACPTNTALDGLNQTPRDDPTMEVLHFVSGNSRGSVRHFLQERVAGREVAKQFVAERVPDRCPGGQP